jgi:hypothetical protein
MVSNYAITMLLTTTNTEQQVPVTTYNAMSSNAPIDRCETSHRFKATNITFRVLRLYMISSGTGYDSVKYIVTCLVECRRCYATES